MAQEIWVLGQLRSGTPSPWTLQLISGARGLADAFGAEVNVLIGESEGTENLGTYGADRAFAVAGATDAAPVETFLSAAEVAMGTAPALTLAPDNIWGRDLASQIAARLGAPLLAACERVTLVEDAAPFRAVRSCYAGQLSAELRMTLGPARVLTVREHAFLASATSDRASCPVTTVESKQDPRVQVLDRRAPDPETLELSDAEVIVSGGRGTGSEDGFRLLGQLAAKLGGTTASSRVAVDLGWMPRTKQVGQTGSRVAPQLYLACGISGAREHMVGIRDAAALVAINTDERAPIMGEADLAVVGDVSEVVTNLLDLLDSGGGTS